MLLRNDKQKIVANGYPYLRVDSILGGSIEGLDVLLGNSKLPLQMQQDVCALAPTRSFAIVRNRDWWRYPWESERLKVNIAGGVERIVLFCEDVS